MEISVYGKVEAAGLDSSQSLCCNCREGNPREAPEHQVRKSICCTEYNTPDALSGAVSRAEIMVWRRKCWCLHFPNLAQTSSLSWVNFGATEAAPRILKCKCDCLLKPWLWKHGFREFPRLELFLREWIYSIHCQHHLPFCDGLFTIYFEETNK